MLKLPVIVLKKVCCVLLLRVMRLIALWVVMVVIELRIVEPEAVLVVGTLPVGIFR